MPLLESWRLEGGRRRLPRMRTAKWLEGSEAWPGDRVDAWLSCSRARRLNGSNAWLVVTESVAWLDGSMARKVNGPMARMHGGELNEMEGSNARHSSEC